MTTNRCICTGKQRNIKQTVIDSAKTNKWPGRAGRGGQAVAIVSILWVFFFISVTTTQAKSNRNYWISLRACCLNYERCERGRAYWINKTRGRLLWNFDRQTYIRTPIMTTSVCTIRRISLRLAATRLLKSSWWRCPKMFSGSPDTNSALTKFCINIALKL